LQLAASTVGQRIVAARVIALAPSQGFDWTATLDRGAQSGVRVGQTVTDGAGLAGRVLHADPATCVVLLAADPGSGVGVRDLRTGQVGVATGRGTSGFRFVPLDPAADVRVGDELATGPAGSTTYVAGLAVGTVTSVRAGADGAASAAVRPTVSATTLDLVGVILVGGDPSPAGPALKPSAQAHR
jgi:rod shape-determining protein MreC